MKLIIGLGNPGERYKNTRHNAGFLVADELQKMKLPACVVVKKSDVFMNDSGNFVKKIVDKYKLNLSDLYIIHDDLDIPLGSYKIQMGVGPKVHNGVNSIETELGTEDFWRVRIGVDSRNPDKKISGEEYVLQNFTDEEKIILDRVIKNVVKDLTSVRN